MLDAVEIEQFPRRRRRAPPGAAELKRSQQRPAAAIASQHVRFDPIVTVRKRQLQAAPFANSFLDGVEGHAPATSRRDATLSTGRMRHGGEEYLDNRGHRPGCGKNLATVTSSSYIALATVT